MSKSKQKMSSEEITQFLTCARIGRLGVVSKGYPYIIPVGYTYIDGKIYIHTCNVGRKIKAMKENSKVCFEVDETLSDVSMYKSVIIFGTAKILDDPESMIPYLQSHIDKYRVPLDFETYISKPGRERDKELGEVRIIEVTPTEISGKKFIRTI